MPEKIPLRPKLPGFSQKDAVRVLERLGWRIIRQGKHLILEKDGQIIQVPRHTTINAFTMGHIAACAGCTPEQFRALK